MFFICSENHSFKGIGGYFDTPLTPKTNTPPKNAFKNLTEALSN
ncbi:hypothetical protein HPHPH36_0222 [Helicobacter pylori Hp H-36]|nr:hypothetical protein HPHPH36_0222 [Helicobacter pylori Hp H-36]EJB71064.1 hypothetical protein HPHPA6_0152 [Helicobacter pylori Hp A-6]